MVVCDGSMSIRGDTCLHTVGCDEWGGVVVCVYVL